MFNKVKSIIFNFFLFLFLTGIFSPANAQDCKTYGDAIVNLRPAALGSYNVWDSVYGEAQDDERFVDALVLESGYVLAVGERVNKDGEKSLIWVEVGRNGRTLWSAEQNIPDLVNITRVLPHEKGAIVLANITPKNKPAHIWIGVFNKSGVLQSTSSIKGGANALTGYDIESSKSGKSYVVAAYAENKKSGQPGWSMLYRINLKGGVMSDQAFVIGSQNAMHDLQRMENGEFIAAGYMNDAGGRKTGWVMRLREDLGMMWQQQYTRGAGAEFHKITPLAPDGLVLTGTAAGTGGANHAAWLAVIEENSGNLSWQRYFTSKISGYSGRDVMVNADRVISVIINGKAIKDPLESMPKPDEKPNEKMAEPIQPQSADMIEHIRLITLDPRGKTLDVQELFNGLQADAKRLILGQNQERIIIGETKVSSDVYSEVEAKPVANAEVSIKPQVKSEKIQNLQGWALAATSAEPYKDPCVTIPVTLP